MTEVRLPAPVKAVPVDDIDADDLPAGAFELSGAPPGGLWYVCPCGCGTQGYLQFKPLPSPSWGWDGDREQPTLTPSVHHVGHWHGFLRAGVWEQA